MIDKEKLHEAITRIKSGDATDKDWGMIYDLITRVIQSKFRVDPKYHDDMRQEIIMRVMRRIPNMEVINPHKTWSYIYTMIYTGCHDAYDKLSRFERREYTNQSSIYDDPYDDEVY